ncbi:MAG: helix-turn-helix transcriptional regulator [Pontixanthobacter sp.]
MIKDNSRAFDNLQLLTYKQKEVLDLLLDHKTSKEIARELGISPHTVDQRINLAKAKLEIASRGELATAYRDAKQIYDKSIYQHSYVDRLAIPLEKSGKDDAAAYTLSNDRKSSFHRVEDRDEADYRVVPEMFEGRFGKAARIVAMLIAALILLLLGIAGLTMFSELSEFFAR